jgi:DNA invertase Pin-like site-specific DNA recombinase
VSSEEQLKNLSLPTQGRLCCEYCERNGWKVVAIFIEWGESAKTTARTSFQEMLRFCGQRKNDIAYLVVYRIDRFARCAEDHAVVAATLRRYGTELRSVTEPIDNSAAGRFMETVLSGMAEMDNRLRADRTRAGLKEALNIGRWGFPAPLGYLNARDANDKPIVVVDDQRAPLIQRAFQQFATGLYSRNQVLKEVTKLGLRTLKGNKMTTQNFAKTLVNEFYTGWLVVAKWGERKRGNFPALVDEDTFNKVQAVLAGRRPTTTPYWPNRPEFPLRRFARCGKCGAPMTATWCTGRTKIRYPYYICSKHCKGIGIRAEELERQFLAILDEMRMKPEVVTLFQAIVRDAWSEKQSRVRELATACQRRLTELEGCRQRLVEAFIYKQAISQEVFQAESSRLDAEIASARIEATVTADGLDVTAVLQFAGQVMLDPAQFWQALPLDQKQRCQRVLFPEGITVTEEKRVRTPVTSAVFKLLQLQSNGKATLGCQSFASWNQIIDWLRQIDQLRQAAVAQPKAA